jgi:hypothetical protein
MKISAYLPESNGKEIVTVVPFSGELTTRILPP